jgi:hypothetical protein
MYKPAPAIIGGLFGLEPRSTARADSIFPSSIKFFLSFRCAVYKFCQHFGPGTAWLPSYLCGVMLDPFRQLRVPVRYYDAGPNFKTGSTGWTIDVARGDVVLVIHYFGFANALFPASELRGRGAVIIEDASQSLFLKQYYPESACIVYSPRKFLGVPDGGLMDCAMPTPVDLDVLEDPPLDWWRTALAVTQMRKEFDLSGGENRWFSLYRSVEETFPLGPYRSSDLTRAIIEAGADYQSIKKVRRENYLALLERLQNFALFPTLDEATVPLGFPVCVNASQRDKILDDLYGRGIYPPVHWRIKDIVPKEYRQSHSLSERILTLICDQRYTTIDMARQSEAFLSAVN